MGRLFEWVGMLVLRMCFSESLYQKWREAEGPHFLALVAGFLTCLWIILVCAVPEYLSGQQRNSGNDLEMLLVIGSLPFLILFVRLFVFWLEWDRKK